MSNGCEYVELLHISLKQTINKELKKQTNTSWHSKMKLLQCNYYVKDYKHRSTIFVNKILSTKSNHLFGGPWSSYHFNIFKLLSALSLWFVKGDKGSAENSYFTDLLVCDNNPFLPQNFYISSSFCGKCHSKMKKEKEKMWKFFFLNLLPTSANTDFTPSLREREKERGGERERERERCSQIIFGIQMSYREISYS